MTHNDTDNILRETFYYQQQCYESKCTLRYKTLSEISVKGLEYPISVHEAKIFTKLFLRIVKISIKVFCFFGYVPDQLTRLAFRDPKCIKNILIYFRKF